MSEIKITSLKLPALCPEEAFLENKPSISHGDMIDCILSRTNAIVDCLHTVVENADVTKEILLSVLWQVSGNLDELQKVADSWHKSSTEDKRVKQKQPVSLRSMKTVPQRLPGAGTTNNKKSPLVAGQRAWARGQPLGDSVLE